MAVGVFFKFNLSTIAADIEGCNIREEGRPCFVFASSLKLSAVMEGSVVGVEIACSALAEEV